MSILVVRHGQTDDNASRVIQFPDSPLSANGIQQAQQLAVRLADMDVTRILSSDYDRTLETAAQVSRVSGIDVESEPLLRERNFGDLRGKSYDEITIDPFAADYEPPQGESWQVFFNRVADAWQRITEAAQQTEGRLLIVTHGFVCRALVANHFTLEEGVELPIRWGNTSLTEVDKQSPWRVQRLNCTEHLETQPSAEGGQA